MYSLRSSAAIIALAAGLWCAPGSANTLFFQMNPNYSTGRQQVFLFGPINSSGTVTGLSGFNQSFNLGAEGFAVVDLPSADQLGAGVIEAKGLRVTSNDAISGYFLNRENFTTDMTYLIDGDKLGTDYYVLGYQSSSPDQMSVQATQDNTVVTFSPRGQTAFQVTLNAGQTYMYAGSFELTGSRIQSDKPVSVFSGNQCANIPSGTSACDHIMEQIPDVESLSSTYLLAQTPRTGTNGNAMRIVATTDATEVKVNGAVVATLNRGEFYEGRVAGGIEVTANHAILVGQYLIGQGEANENTDPAMTIVPGSDQWLKSYVFATPSGDADFPTDFVSIVIQTSSLGTLRVDGTVADATLFNPLGSSIYSYGNIDVSGTTGPFTIVADTPFQLLLSGFDDYDSYFTYGGAVFAPGASPPPTPTPPPPPPPPGVDVYWDGDGPTNANNDRVDGGDGVLSAASLNLTLENGDTNNSLPTDPATIVFKGAPGTVSVSGLSGQVRVAGLRFEVTGYTLNGETLTLGGSNPFVQVGDNTDATKLFLAIIENEVVGAGGFRKTGNGILWATGNNSYTGLTAVEQGTLLGTSRSFGTGGVAVSEGATLVIRQLEADSFGSGISGAGNFYKIGPAALTLDGANSLSGSTFVNEGLLRVNGTLASSDVIVGPGGRLGGTGTVGSVTVQAGGTVAPGASIGTLTVDGAYVQEDGSIYEVELNSTGATDLLNITGTATLAPDSGLRVVRLDALRPPLNHRYTVLTAADGLTGTYGEVTGNTALSAFIHLLPSYDANNVYLTVSKDIAFATAALTPNQRAAATGADAAGNGAMYQAIAWLPNPATAAAAFDQISGEIHASVRGAAVHDSRFVREAILNRTAGEAIVGKGLWFHGYGSWGSFDGDGNAAKMRRDIGGFFIGGEMVNDSGLVVGALAGYGEADISVSNRNSDADTKDGHLGGYAGFKAMGFDATAGVAYMWRDVRTQRSVVFPGFAGSHRAKYDTNVFQMFADVGTNFALGGFQLKPFFQLTYLNIGGSSFDEDGASSAVHSVSGGSGDYFLSQLGVRFDTSVGGGLGVRGSVGWKHLISGHEMPRMRMAYGAGPAFDIRGGSVGKDLASLMLGIGGNVSSKVEVDVGYSGEVGSGISDHGLKGSVTFRF